MKKYITLLLLFSVIFQLSYAQNIGIGTTTPDPSAMLDVSSTNKGFLTPRMLQSQRDLIASPAPGLLIYQTDNTPGYYFYNGTAWLQLASGGGTNYWSASGSNIFSNHAGKVGIGTSTPGDKLTVKTGGFGITHTNGDAVISTWIGPFEGGSVSMIGTRSNHPFSFYTNNSSALLTIGTNGNVGIGIDEPANKLQIGGTTPGYGGNHIAIGNGTQAMVFNQGATNSLWQSHSNISIMPKDGTGNVGIGTLNPTYKLSVNGNIRSKEVVVETNWADYVFDEKYILNPLEEVEKFIQKNKHLPNIPAAAEIEREGLNLGDTQKKMMEKIEELTLYVIQLAKQNNRLQKEIDLLKK